MVALASYNLSMAFNIAQLRVNKSPMYLHRNSIIQKRYSRTKLNTSNDTIGISDNGPKQHNISLKTKEGTHNFKVYDGEILRSAALKRGISVHNGNSRLINCRGLGTCGTCAVEIESNNAQKVTTTNAHSNIDPTERNMKENLRLKFPPHGSNYQSPNLRLACQVQVRGDISVTKRSGFWGQASDGQLAERNDAKLYFGNLEYVMDNKSPEIQANTRQSDMDNDSK